MAASLTNYDQLDLTPLGLPGYIFSGKAQDAFYDGKRYMNGIVENTANNHHVSNPWNTSRQNQTHPLMKSMIILS